MTGWMWSDTDKKASLEEKVRAAAARYTQRFQQAPTLCQVNPAAVDGDTELVIDGIKIEPHPGISPDHFFFTREQGV